MTLNMTLLKAPPDATQPTVVSDMEGTLSSGVTWKGMRDYLLQHGYEAQVKGFLRQNLLRGILFRIGFIRDAVTFQKNWMMGILNLFAGLTHEEFVEAVTWVVENELWPNRRQDVIDELLAHQANGRRVVVASGMFEPMLKVYVDKLGFEAIGTPVLFEGDVFTGRLVGEFNTGALKAEQVAAFLNENGQLYAAYGDTGADIQMLLMAQHPTAVYPDNDLRTAAQQNGWRILE